MTDNDIKKALECCKAHKYICANECPYLLDDDCEINLSADALDLINRREVEIEKLNVELVGMRGACESYKIHYDNAQAEIERLNIRNKALTDITKNYDWKFAKAKSEAIKEFAERLKEISDRDGWTDSSEIDNLVKEMTEVQEC